MIDIPKLPKEKLKVDAGVRIGRLLIGELVRFVQDHELFYLTPTSYLQQGRLRECVCDCGQRRLISESILATGRLQSCGCLRAEIRSSASMSKVKRLQDKAEQTNLQLQIQIEQAKMRALTMTPVPYRDEKECQKTIEILRQLYLQKGALTRRLNLQKDSKSK